jgi:GNAT superfamily N-acetyltransferase
MSCCAAPLATNETHGTRPSLDFVEEIITYLEMTGPDQLNPARPAAGVVLEQVDRTSPLIVPTQARVGAPHGWRSSTRSDEEWARWLAHPLRQYWLIKHETDVAGIADLEPHPAGEVEITTFGLLPEFVGKGLGGHALTLTIRQAWEFEGARRVWLHTSTRDHPNALPNYQRRGFRPFRTEVRQPDH